MSMTRIKVLVEGPAEEKFVKEILYPQLVHHNIFIESVTVCNKVEKSGKRHKGGYTPYSSIKKQIKNFLGDSSLTYVTTMFDYYALYEDFPGMDSPISGKAYEKVAFLENKLKNDIGDRRFIPYIQLHEFESLLFSSIDGISNFTSNQVIINEFQSIITQYPNPEDINNSPETAPSKRIEKIIKGYRKPLHGISILKNIEFQEILNKCPHFSEWINKISN